MRRVYASSADQRLARKKRHAGGTDNGVNEAMLRMTAAMRGIAPLTLHTQQDHATS